MICRGAILLIILSQLLSFSFSLFCPKITCNQIETPVTNSTCAVYSSNATHAFLDLYSCQTGQYCPIRKPDLISIGKLKETKTCTNFTLGYWSGLNVGKLVENDYCYINTDCASRICENHLCKGKAKGDNCTQDDECSLLSFCNKTSLKCIPKLEDNEACLSSKYCKPGRGCLYGTCVPYYSLPEGTKIGDTKLGMFCETGFVGPDGRCEGLYNTGTAPYMCDDINMCQYVSSLSKTSVQKSLCVCDFSGSGNSYCMAGTNSPLFKAFIKAKKEFITSDGCQYDQDFGCTSTSKELFSQYLETAFDVYQSLNNYTSSIMSCLNRETPQVNPAVCTSLPCLNETLTLERNFLDSFSMRYSSWSHIGFLLLIIITVTL